MYYKSIKLCGWGGGGLILWFDAKKQGKETVSGKWSWRTGARRFLVPVGECEFALNTLLDDLSRDAWPTGFNHKRKRKRKRKKEEEEEQEEDLRKSLPAAGSLRPESVQSPKKDQRASQGSKSSCTAFAAIACDRIVWPKSRFAFVRDGKTTIEITFALLRRVGLRGREENRPKMLFSGETPRQYNFECANFIVEKFGCHCAGS